MKIEWPPKFSTADFHLLKDLLAKKHEAFISAADKRYWYWDELKHRPNLPYNDAEKAWCLVKFHRQQKAKSFSLGSYQFSYNVTSEMHKNLHEFDLKLMGGLRENPISDADQRQYLKNSLQEEAIASSQIEGAATTTQMAWEMLKQERAPKNESEQMIFNNQRAIKFIIEMHNEDLTPELIIRLHSILTIKTSAEKYSGDFRHTPVNVVDHVDGEVAHVAPDADEVLRLMNDLCVFANTEKEFVHPILKASMLHFFIGFIHPFSDGNGRTARALFYWYMMKKEYSLIRHISISRAILDSRTQYDKAYLKTEQDDNDMTYFLLYSIKGLRVAFESLVRFRDRKKQEHLTIESLVRELVQSHWNERQALALAEMQTKQNVRYSLSDYAEKFKITRQTAAKDLAGLVKRAGLIELSQGRNKFYFLPKVR
jgi:Fic family protein